VLSAEPRINCPLTVSSRSERLSSFIENKITPACIRKRDCFGNDRGTLRYRVERRVYAWPHFAQAPRFPHPTAQARAYACTSSRTPARSRSRSPPGPQKVVKKLHVVVSEGRTEVRALRENAIGLPRAAAVQQFWCDSRQASVLAQLYYGSVCAIQNLAVARSKKAGLTSPAFTAVA